MDIIETLDISPVILTEGSVLERLYRETSLELDPYIAHSGLINEYQRAYNDYPCPGYVKLAQLVIDGKHKFPWL